MHNFGVMQMPNKAPLFSVVIPTTRARLLKYSVRSVLVQTLDDFEIVVSDNQAQGVEEALRCFADRRVRHVRTPSRLPINKSWEYGFDNAHGRWVLLLADDDVILPGLLEEIKVALLRHPEAEIVTWRHGGFVENEYHVASARGNLASPPFTGASFLVNNRETLARLYDLGGSPEGFADAKRSYPGIAYSAYTRELIDRVKAKAGVLFNPTTPDYAAGAAALALSKWTLVIDKPLMIFHSTSDSNAAAASGDLTTLKQVYAELTDEPFRNVPFKGYLTNRNVIADTLLDMRRILPDELGEYDVKVPAYFKFVLFGLDQVREQSGNTPIVRQEFEDFYAALGTQPLTTQDEVRAYAAVLAQRAATQPFSPTRRRYASLRKLVREALIGMLLRMHPLLAPITGRLAQRSGMSTNGRYAGIDDIFEFSQVLGRVIGGPGKA